MSTVTPTALSCIAGSWINAYEYRLRSSSSTYAFYDLWNLSTSTWVEADDRHSIKVGIDSSLSDYNTWIDHGHATPTVTETSNGTVQCFQASTILVYEFTKPTTASWISSGTGGSGGGTTTESVYTYQVDFNKSRLVLYDFAPGTYELGALFGNGDVWSITIPSSGSYTLFPGGTEASPANSDSTTEFAVGNYEIFSKINKQLLQHHLKHFHQIDDSIASGGESCQFQ